MAREARCQGPDRHDWMQAIGCGRLGAGNWTRAMGFRWLCSSRRGEVKSHRRVGGAASCELRFAVAQLFAKQGYWCWAKASLDEAMPGDSDGPTARRVASRRGLERELTERAGTAGRARQLGRKRMRMMGRNATESLPASLGASRGLGPASSEFSRCFSVATRLGVSQITLRTNDEPGFRADSAQSVEVGRAGRASPRAALHRDPL